jgi:four helix bundle protein
LLITCCFGAVAESADTVEKILSYRDLDAWKVGMTVVQQTYELSRAFPPEERYGLCAQMRRASVSIPSNIAEGQGRRLVKSCLYFVNVAIGSSGELDTQLELARRLRFVSPETAGELQASIDRVRQLLHGMRRQKQLKLLGTAGVVSVLFGGLFLRLFT